ncbi:hypothetical protein XCV1025 [Xanthomonas euvesicatoria pv. vesicatoria str. 85-10]|uniref:Uncharacterized protein n=1 Tax=Xanthomonas euvesicatoria pv. vesicatoria (strain 85-10) TaxID=316273 RepID=Q3BWV7_XANE5|nr:hypothetical protein XCV1025 [Xanthomonas euvesicatoria pv. vesicatoria str. 85-10]
MCALRSKQGDVAKAYVPVQLLPLARPIAISFRLVDDGLRALDCRSRVGVRWALVFRTSHACHPVSRRRRSAQAADAARLDRSLSHAWSRPWRWLIIDDLTQGKQ